MVIFFTLMTILVPTFSMAHGDYCTPEVQHQAPYAFALNRESLEFHTSISQEALSERSQLIKKIKTDPNSGAESTGIYTLCAGVV